MKFITPLIFLLLGACSSIDRSSDLDRARFTFGQTSKQEVVSAIGLPNKIERRDSTEYWIYSGKELKSDIFIPLPIAANKVSTSTYDVYYTDIGPKNTYNIEPALVCVFNKDMKLINAFDPRKK